MPRETQKKIITNEERIASINPKNKKLVDRFMKNFDTKRSDASVRVYRSNFNIFFCWNLLYNDNKFFVDVKKMDFMDFFDYAVTDLMWSPNRYAQMWSSLSSLSNFIENFLDDDYPEFRNQVKKIEKIPKAVVRKKTILTDEQVESLLAYLSETDKTGQQACLFALAVYSGSRISELFRFTTELIDVNNTAFEDVFIETKDEIKTKGRGKIGKSLYKYILKKPFVPYYEKWIKNRKEIMENIGVSHDFIFIRQDGSPATATTGRSWLKKWESFLSDKNGEDFCLYFHAMRHYLCTYLARNDIPSELIQELFGWSDISLVGVYNDMTAKDKKWKALEKLK